MLIATLEISLVFSIALGQHNSSSNENRSKMSIFSTTATVFLIVCVDLSTASAGPTNRSEWFKGLMMPGTQNSCCDIADCKKTTARWQKDRWWADVKGKWQPIPSDTVLAQPKSLDGEAYVCVADPLTDDSHYIGDRIYCFVPPDIGS